MVIETKRLWMDHEGAFEEAQFFEWEKISMMVRIEAQ